MTFTDRLLRPGRDSAADVRIDLLWLLAFGMVLIATGIGLRDPWPADEPRFALIARDMVASGQWLIPQVGGDLYADKPPLFFWAVGVFLLATGSLRAAFLLPSLLAGIGSVLLVYDLARRLWNREHALIAALALLFTVQFLWQARQAQLDAFLCFWTTLSLYALLRHLLLGPAWGWYCVGWAAAGLGIISKGVGFLPLLVLIPAAFLRSRASTASAETTRAARWRWGAGPLALLVAISVWLGPMLWAASDDASLARYRDEILFGQTVNRYADAWHHREPFWYFIVEVIPLLWLPFTALLPWLAPHWRASWRARDARVLLPLIWTLLVIVFFSLSSGKRGVYILPAVPALVLGSAPFLKLIAARRGVQRTLFGISCFIAVVTIAAALYLWTVAEERQTLIDAYGLDAAPPLLLIGLSAIACCAVARPRRGAAAYAGVLTSILLVVSFWVNPAMNDARSGAAFARTVEAAASDIEALGVVAYKEQYLLNFARPIVNFGHARWRDFEQEAADAAAWLAAAPSRWVLVEQQAKDACFATAQTRYVGTANRESWYLVGGEADPQCVQAGDARAARLYRPPTHGHTGAQGMD